MTIKERLEQAQAKATEQTEKYNALESQRNAMLAQQQECLKEILRLEGEIRVLKELSKE